MAKKKRAAASSSEWNQLISSTLGVAHVVESKAENSAAHTRFNNAVFRQALDIRNTERVIQEALVVVAKYNKMKAACEFSDETGMQEDFANLRLAMHARAEAMGNYVASWRRANLRKMKPVEIGMLEDMKDQMLAALKTVWQPRVEAPKGLGSRLAANQTNRDLAVKYDTDTVFHQRAKELVKDPNAARVQKLTCVSTGVYRILNGETGEQLVSQLDGSLITIEEEPNDQPINTKWFVDCTEPGHVIISATELGDGDSLLCANETPPLREGIDGAPVVTPGEAMVIAGGTGHVWRVMKPRKGHLPALEPDETGVLAYLVSEGGYCLASGEESEAVGIEAMLVETTMMVSREAVWRFEPLNDEDRHHIKEGVYYLQDDHKRFLSVNLEGQLIGSYNKGITESLTLTLTLTLTLQQRHHRKVVRQACAARRGHRARNSFKNKDSGCEKISSSLSRSLCCFIVFQFEKIRLFVGMLIARMLARPNPAC